MVSHSAIVDPAGHQITSMIGVIQLYPPLASYWVQPVGRKLITLVHNNATIDIIVM